MKLKSVTTGFQLEAGGKIIFSHTHQRPMVFVGQGKADIDAYRGNFQINDYIEERCPLRDCVVEGNVVKLYGADGGCYTMTFCQEGSRVTVKGSYSGSANRMWLRLSAKKDEAVFGGGEQYSCLNLRGKRFEIFTREQGVGRNKSEYVTFLADKEKSGGDYDWTCFPQPTFLSSQNYLFHLENYCYSVLDFSHEEYHEVEIWDTEITVVLDEGENLKSLVCKLSDYLGRQPRLPEWAFKGIWLGIQGGTQTVEKKLALMREKDTHVTGIWCQDWQGIRMTSFGKRLMWNWMVDNELYPGLKESIVRWNKEGIHFMGYINPYVCEEKSLFKEAKEKGLLALNSSGEVYLVDFGEFYCGIVDFTNPVAFAWYKEVIKNNLLAMGLEGWMADFGEYLPTDCVLHSGEDPMTAHNRWPMLWAKLNYEAMEETGKLGETAVYFRAGAAGTQRYAPMQWAGDQNVDWSLDDGLASVIVAALSAGICGCGIHSSDTGGYTTLYHLKRTKELLMRWAEFSTFTPVLRTHEGNRPDVNWQFDSDKETIEHFSRCSRLHTQLYPYIKAVAEEYYTTGIPAMRPLFLEYPQDSATYQLKYQYLLGSDLLVAPVYTEGAQAVELYAPDDRWVSLWDDSCLSPGMNRVSAPMGRPAVYYRKGSEYTGIFASLKDIT